jgi:ribosomal protein S7
MVRVHMSAKKYELLSRYDRFLNIRKDTTFRYYVLFLFFYKDYFVYKIINKLMTAGHKHKALFVLKCALLRLKEILGFQPFFFFKHITFRMRQLFKVNTRVIRSKVTYYPVVLRAHNQVTYGISHLIKSSRQLCKEERHAMHDALSIILLNSFISSSVSQPEY